jgi:nucleoside-diphosphate-sugar epimerase
MKVFVTGATGFIGQAVVQELLTAGHQVLGLVRSDASAAALSQLGVEAHRGELSDLDSLAAGARACDGVIHTAFIHDLSQFEANAQTDQRALAAMAQALEGTHKPLVATSGTAVLAPGRIGTEADAPAPDGLGRIRAASEVVLAAADRGVRVSAVRLPPSVHDRGDHGFVPALIDVARRTGVAAYVGDGDNRWPAVHRLDAARLLRLALEKATPGSRLHGVGEEGVPMRAIAEAIGQGLGIPVRSLSADEAAAHFGWMALFIAIDNTTSSARTRESLGWQPQRPGLLADMRDSGYFA